MKHRGDEDRSASMRLHRLFVHQWIWFPRCPFTVVVDDADGIPQRAAQSRCATELGRELSEQILLRLERPARVRHLMSQDLWKGEVLKQRDEVREPFVQRQHVRI